MFKAKRGYHKTKFLQPQLEECLIVGTFDGHCVQIQGKQQMELLHRQGGFGKGNLSRSHPKFNSIYSDEQCEETLNLGLEESFFLTYAIGCLLVKFDNNYLTIDEIWTLFRETSPDFLPRYVSYHHFRMSGWIVRSGIKFGSDFVLYKHGPEFYHSTYSVQVVNWLDNNQKNNIQDWIQLATINRITESSAKEVLISFVISADDKRDFTSPECIQKLKLHNIVLKRWVPTQERSANSV